MNNVLTVPNFNNYLNISTSDNSTFTPPSDGWIYISMECYASTNYNANITLNPLSLILCRVSGNGSMNGTIFPIYKGQTVTIRRQANVNVRIYRFYPI